MLHSHPVWLPQTGTWLFNQVRFVPNDIESHIVCEELENEEQFHMGNTHCVAAVPWLNRLRKLPVRGSGRLVRYLWLRRTCRKLRPGIVHSHFGNVGYYDSAVTKRLAIPHIVTFYGLDVNKLPKVNRRWGIRYHRLFRDVRLCLCEGPHMAQCLIRLGCPTEKVLVHHLGIDLENVPFRPRSWHPGLPLRVLIAATFREKKGIPYALEALAEVRKKRAIEITVIGDASADPQDKVEKNRIIATVQQHGLKEVKFLGFQPHSRLLEEAYAHHVFLSPSVQAKDGDTEGGAPVSLIEMAASGMPIVSTTHCDIPEVLPPSTAAALVPERSVKDLASALLSFAGDWDGVACRLPVTRAHIERNFSAKTQALTLRRVYLKTSGTLTPEDLRAQL